MDVRLCTIILKSIIVLLSQTWSRHQSTYTACAFSAIWLAESNCISAFSVLKNNYIFCCDYSITRDISIVTLNFTRHLPLHFDILLIALNIPWNTTMNQAIVLLIKNWMGYCEKKEIASTTLKSPLIEILMLISKRSSLKSSVEFAKTPCIWLYT